MPEEGSRLFEINSPSNLINSKSQSCTQPFPKIDTKAHLQR